MVSGFDSPLTTAIDGSFVHPHALWHDIRRLVGRVPFADFQEVTTGADFTAADVVASIERVPKVPNSPSPFTAYTKQITKIEVVDPYTIRFKTAQPYPLMPSDMSQIAIISKQFFSGVNPTAAFIFALDWRLAIVALGLLPLFIVPTRRAGRRRKQLKRRVQEHVGELTGMLTETLSVSGALLVKVFGGERAEVERLAAKAEQIRQLSLQQSLVGRWFQMLLGLFEAVGPAIVFATGGVLVIRGEVAVGTIVAFVTALKRLYGPASSLAGVYVDLMTSYAYFERVFAVLDRTPSIRETPNAVAPRSVKGEIEFRGVSFTYDDSGTALSNIDLVIPAGATVAIVGPSGAGKSTIALLAMRLYDPSEGSVTIDGIDTRLLKTSSLRDHVAVVMQDTFLFHISVLDNLRYAAPSATLADVEAAARDARIHELIASLPDGYNTIVGERGYRFSAGERQRLAIARAILRDPRILILDEATNALDVESERQVLQALAAGGAERTSLVIAHRLSTVRHADLIVALDGGRIVERGTHEQLLMRSGLYARLWKIQSGEEQRWESDSDSRRMLTAVG